MRNLIIFAFIISFTSKGKAQQWSSWVPMAANNEYPVSFSYKIGDCSLSFNSHYGLKNETNEKIHGSISFNYTPCNGNIESYQIGFVLDPFEENKSPANWLICKKGSRITDMQITYISFPEREQREYEEKVRMEKAEKAAQEEQRLKDEADAKEKRINEEEREEKSRLAEIEEKKKREEHEAATQTYNSYTPYKTQDEILKSEAAARSENRIADAQKQSDAFTALGATMMDVALNSDITGPKKYTKSAFGFMFTAGLGFGSVPIIENTTGDGYTPTSSTASALGYGLSASADIWLIKGKNFGFGGFMNFDWCAASAANSSGSFTILDLGLRCAIGPENIKGLFELTESSRIVTTESETGENFLVGYNLTTEGSADFVVNKLSYGFLIEFGKEESSGYFSFLYSIDKPDFLKGNYSLHSAKFNYCKGPFNLGFEFSQNYVIAGNRKYDFGSNTYDNQDYWVATIGVPFSCIFPY